MITLLASAARTTSDTAAISNVNHLEMVESGVFFLNISAAAAAVGDTLDVYLQHTVDGTNYDDFVHFTQALGNGGAKKFQAQWERDVTPTTPQKAPNDAALSAGVAQGPVGSSWRLKWVVVDGGAHGQAFTFSVTAQLQYRRP